MYGANAPTVSSPGDLVSPEATLRSVWNGTPESSESFCNCNGLRGASAVRTASEVGTDSFMGSQHTGFGTLCLPLSVDTPAYARGMSKPDAKTILIENVTLLMKSRYGKINITRFGQETGLSNGGTQRVLDPATSVGVDQLNKIAEAFDVEVWQLLAPDLGQAMRLSPAELEKVREMREPQQPKAVPLGDRAKQDLPFNLGDKSEAVRKGGRRREA
jgi:hypothetical protein